MRTEPRHSGEASPHWSRWLLHFWVFHQKTVSEGVRTFILNHITSSTTKNKPRFLHRVCLKRDLYSSSCLRTERGPSDVTERDTAAFPPPSTCTPTRSDSSRPTAVVEVTRSNIWTQSRHTHTHTGVIPGFLDAATEHVRRRFSSSAGRRTQVLYLSKSSDLYLWSPAVLDRGVERFRKEIHRNLKHSRKRFSQKIIRLINYISPPREPRSSSSWWTKNSDGKQDVSSFGVFLMVVEKDVGV